MCVYIMYLSTLYTNIWQSFAACFRYSIWMAMDS